MMKMMLMIDKMLRFVQVMKPRQEWMRLINGRGNSDFTCWWLCELD